MSAKSKNKQLSEENIKVLVEFFTLLAEIEKDSDTNDSACAIVQS